MKTSEPSIEDIDRTGTIIDGRFAVDRLIARGGFSAVYRAQRLADDETVAVKVLELGPSTTATSMERFTREAEFIAELQSPNTVRIFETGQVGQEFLYSVMEYIAGRSLYAQLRKKGALNPRQVAEVTVQLCNALAEVHERGLLHRDLKPSNMMLFRDDNRRVVVKLLDFGVAKMLDPPPAYEGLKLTTARTFIGTPRYASPEQMRREPLTSASDVYAVGMIMWEALVGSPAIPQTDYSACLKAHINREPWQLPREPRFPHELVGIIEKSLAKPVHERYQSCVELEVALQKFLRNRSQERARRSGPHRTTQVESSAVVTSVGGTSVSKQDKHNPSTIQDVEAQDELFGEVIEHSDAHLDSVNVMARSDLSETSSTAGSSIHLPSRNSSHSGVGADDRPVAAAPKSAMSGGVGLTIGLAVLVVGGIFLLTLGGNDSGATDQDSEVTAPVTAKKVQAPVDDEGHGDGTPTLDVATVTKGMVASGWRVGEGSVDKMDDVTQTNVMAQKDGMAATVTIYESRTWDWANKLLLETEPPARAISFGRTVARVSLGPPQLQNGTVELLKALTSLKKSARAEAAGQVIEAAPTQ